LLEPIWGEVPTAGSICGICPLEVKIKMLQTRELRGQNPKQYGNSPIKSAENCDLIGDQRGVY
jgi:hypothetical protein